MKTLIIRTIVYVVVFSPCFLWFWVLYWSGREDREMLMINCAAIIIIIAFTGGLIHFFLRQREAYWRRNEPNHWREHILVYQKELPSRIESASVTCKKCNSTAKPILNSGNGYLCSSCGEEFAGPDHKLIDAEHFVELHPSPQDRPYPLKP